MENLEIKVKVGYEDKLSVSVDDELEFVNEWEMLAYYPVNIELVKCEGYCDDEDNGNKEEVVATLKGLYFDIEYMDNEGIPLFDVFDSYDQAVHELYNVLFDGDEYKDEFELFNPNLFYLTDINIDDKYKSYDYKEMLLDKLEEILRYIAKLNVGLIATETYVVTESSNEFIDDDKKKAKELLVDNGYVFASDNEDYWIKEIF